ncbi:MAG: M13 family metallopeptidase [Kofleriaceae bacterium]
MRNALALILLAACGGSKAPATEPAPPPTGSAAVADVQPVEAPTKPVTTKSLQQVGLDPALLDRTADPCENFYQFACGGYMKQEIPADKSSINSFVSIDDRNTEYEKQLLEAAAAKPSPDQLGTFFGACMDQATIDKAGIAPLKPMLAQIAAIKDPKSLSAVITQLHAQGNQALFSLDSTQDSADATKVIADVDQGGLGAPDRDYYVKDDAESKRVMDAYRAFVTATLVDVGRKPDDAAKAANAIIAFETELAKVSKTRVERRDPKTMYNRLDRAGVAKAMPHFAWDAFWKGTGISTVQEINVDSPKFLEGVDALMTATPMPVWRDYLTSFVVRANAPFLSATIENQAFEYRKAILGIQELEPRWKRCARATDAALGDLLGQAFVRDKFAGQSKQAAEDQVHAIVAAMTANLEALPWMDPETKKRAAEKLQAMAYQIGYPEKWKTYAFKVDRKTYAANVQAARSAETARRLAKIGKPVDKSDWGLTVPTVNAYYDASLNGMVFPAGILQPPFYSVDASVAVNAGGMGMVVGHELTHGFDDQGAQFDALGNLKDWWQPDTEKQFNQKTKCVVDQYSGYEIVGVKLNGANTVGENIADIGGVKLAFAAYRSLRSSSPDTVVADGFTEDQQFFLGFGQSWCEKSRPELEKMLAATNEHSPSLWRVNGTLSDTPDFAKAFRCKAASKMRPKNACVVW